MPLYTQLPVCLRPAKANCTDVFPGYRSVPLKNGFNESIELASLLVYVDIQLVEVRVSPYTHTHTHT